MKDTFTAAKRIESIDVLRGIVIILMALDHTRDYFHADAMEFAPLDLSKTTVPIFFTRWITHFCAPVFVFLAGTSAFLMGQRKTKKELSFFLFTRGVWLLLLELTVVNFGWTFNIHFPFIVLGVIWALGISMIALSVVIHFHYKIVLILGALIVFGHNLLDNIRAPGKGIAGFMWAALHEPLRNHDDSFQLGGVSIYVDYPVLPWIGIMFLGFCFGRFYKSTTPSAVRRRSLLIIGSVAVLLFLLFRFVNYYGDPRPWSSQGSVVFTILSFLRISKYPPSLQFILMTLGPALLFLAVIEKKSSGFGRAVMHIGRVPMFFYLIHIYVIHVLALIVVVLSGYEWYDMVSKEPFTPIVKGYGFSLLVVYVIWILIVLILYPFCKRYDNYKAGHRDKSWLSYL